MKLHHISLNCQDLAVVERFYTRHFNFRRARVVPVGNGQIVFLKDPNGLYLELFQAQGERPPLSNEGALYPGLRNISFQVDDVDAKVAEMGAAARISFGPLDFEAFIPGWRSIWLADPEGNIVQITQGFTDQENPPPLPPE